MRPSQKVGIDRATIAPRVIAWSNSEYCRTALTMPVASPSSTATANALSISTTVAGIRSAITSRTTRPSRYERPQSPITMPFAHFTYWTWSGWSRPSKRVSRSASSALMVGLMA